MLDGRQQIEVRVDQAGGRGEPFPLDVLGLLDERRRDGRDGLRLHRFRFPQRVGGGCLVLLLEQSLLMLQVRGGDR